MNRTFRVLSVALAGVLLIGAAGCSRDVAATVNGQTISKSSIDTQLAQLKKQYPQMFAGPDAKTREADFFSRLLDNEVNQVLVEQEAAKQNVSVSDAEVQKQIDALKKGFASDTAFQAALTTNNMTMDKLKQQEKIQLETQALIAKLTKNTQVSEAEMAAYYEKNKASLFANKASIHPAHILFDVNDKATAEKVLAEVKANPSSFATLAKKYSKDTASAAKGGDLGWPSTPYLPEFEKAIAATPAGQLDPSLVKTAVGWHIIKVIEKRGNSIRPYASVKDQIRQMVLQQKQADAFQKLLDQLKKAAKITYANGTGPVTPSASTSSTGQ